MLVYLVAGTVARAALKLFKPSLQAQHMLLYVVDVNCPDARHSDDGHEHEKPRKQGAHTPVSGISARVCLHNHLLRGIFLLSPLIAVD